MTLPPDLPNNAALRGMLETTERTGVAPPLAEIAAEVARLGWRARLLWQIEETSLAAVLAELGEGFSRHGVASYVFGEARASTCLHVEMRMAQLGWTPETDPCTCERLHLPTKVG
jgi:hypothetical protein